MEELPKHGYKLTVTQCRGKIEALKAKYKQIADRLRRSGAGRESDKESEELSELPFFALLDTVLGRRASVRPVYLLDSSSANRPDTPAVVPGETLGSRPDTLTAVSSETPVSRSDTPTAGPLETPVSRPDTPAPVPGETPVSRPHTPVIPEIPTPMGRSLDSTSTTQPSTSHDTPSMSSGSGTPTLKKRCKRPNKLHRAEAAAKGIIKEVMDSQEKAKRRRYDLEERRLELEAKREERENERDWQFRATMTNMMTMMNQYMGAALYPPMHVPPSYQPQSPMPMPPSYGPPHPTYQPPSHPLQDSESDDDS